MIGVIGRSDAGKSTFLSVFYLLLARGHSFGAGRFAGSYTLEGWENLARSMRLRPPEYPTFPPHTPFGAGRVPGLLHLALRTPDEDLVDLLLTDASGEWFEHWAADEEAAGAEGARWIAEHAHGFLFFIDCARLAGTSTEAAAAFAETLALARRLADHAGSRRVALVWAKADESPSPNFASRLEAQLSRLFPNAMAFHVSTQMVNQPHAVSRYLDAVTCIAGASEPLGTEFPRQGAPQSDLFFQIGAR